LSENGRKPTNPSAGGAQSGALPPEIEEIALAWSQLMPAVRAGILAMVRAAE
jgi:hypothetical protein